MPEGTTSEHNLAITDSAATRIAKLREMEGNPELMLRVTISGGGCSGFQYGFSLDEQVADDDITFEHNGIQVVTDEASMGLLEGSVVNFVEDLGGSFFQIENPNASSSCGCGSSFAV